MKPKPEHIASLITVLEEARNYLARPDNDFAWSSWENAAEALREMDGLITRLKNNEMPPRMTLNVLFLATGPIQEVAESSGWGNEFITLAKRFDKAVNRLYGRDPQELAAQKADLARQMNELFGGRARWFFTALATAAIGFAVYLYYSQDPTEVYFPIHLKGDQVFYAMVTAAAIFGILATLNWISWRKMKSQMARNVFPPPAK